MTFCLRKQRSGSFQWEMEEAVGEGAACLHGNAAGRRGGRGGTPGPSAPTAAPLLGGGRHQAPTRLGTPMGRCGGCGGSCPHGGSPSVVVLLPQKPPRLQCQRVVGCNTGHPTWHREASSELGHHPARSPRERCPRCGPTHTPPGHTEHGNRTAPSPGTTEMCPPGTPRTGPPGTWWRSRLQHPPGAAAPTPGIPHRAAGKPTTPQPPQIPLHSPCSPPSPRLAASPSILTSAHPPQGAQHPRLRGCTAKPRCVGAPGAPHPHGVPQGGAAPAPLWGHPWLWQPCSGAAAGTHRKGGPAPHAGGPDPIKGPQHASRGDPSPTA